MSTTKDPRSYVRIAVDLPANRKLSGADPRTKWLDVVAVCWAGQNLTDGEVPPAVMVALAGVPPRCATELFARDRWHAKGHHCPDCPQPKVAGHAVIHHYLIHQDSAEQVVVARTNKSLLGRRLNHFKWHHEGLFEDCPVCHE